MLENWFLEYPITPEIKGLICAALAVCLFVVHIWNPKRKRRQREFVRHRLLEYLDIDPGEYGREKEKLMIPDIQPPRLIPNPTLERLDDYVKILKEQTIQNQKEF
ncbi:MAG TPA: hypothetical protein PKV38_03000 [bacterium]|nr:hypothetical protein [bacterium]